MRKPLTEIYPTEDAYLDAIEEFFGEILTHDEWEAARVIYSRAVIDAQFPAPSRSFGD